MKRFALLLAVTVSLGAFAQDAGHYLDAGVLDAGMSAATDAGVLLADPVAITGVPAAAPNLDGDFVGFLKAVHSAVLGKEWGKLVFFIVTLLVWASRKFLGAKWTWLASAPATIVKTFLLTFTGMLATTWGAGMVPTSADIFSAVQLGFGAAGGWSILKALLETAAKKWDWAKWLHGIIVGVAKPAPVEAPATVPPTIPPAA